MSSPATARTSTSVAAGHPVQAFVTLEIAQGKLDDVAEELESLPNVLEAYVTSGSADVVCKIAATSHEDLQATLLHISKSGSVVRSTSVIVLSELVKPRVLPMLARDAAPSGPRPLSLTHGHVIFGMNTSVDGLSRIRPEA